jgi:hypothetical protein
MLRSGMFPLANHIRLETIIMPTRMSAFRRSGIGASGMRATLKSERSGGDRMHFAGTA